VRLEHLEHLAASVRQAMAMSEPTERAYRINKDAVTRLQRQRKLSQNKLARMVGVHVKTLAAWLRGRPAFRTNISELADALGATEQEIIHPEDWRDDQSQDVSQEVTLVGGSKSLHQNLGEKVESVKEVEADPQDKIQVVIKLDVAPEFLESFLARTGLEVCLTQLLKASGLIRIILEEPKDQGESHE
jgi:transcriptional regulator with XRE-family HTH domain